MANQPPAKRLAGFDPGAGRRDSNHFARHGLDSARRRPMAEAYPFARLEGNGPGAGGVGRESNPRCFDRALSASANRDPIPA